MIFTKNWLNEWINLENISLEKLGELLNRIGLEVDRMFHFEAPKGVVVGKILEIQKHENADKLRVCKINIGDEVLQIVTNDQNVQVGDFVPVATVGTKLPNFKIKKGKLRGVESFGMLCSTEEFGIPRVGTGVVVLDNSIGELIPGKAVADYPIFNDDLIEIELTANRGDALSIYGIARDLKAVLNLEFKKSIPEIGVEIGEFENIEYAIKYLNVKSVSEIPLLIKTRLAIIEKLENNEKDILTYLTHSTGVIAKFVDEKSGEKLEFENGILKSGNSQISIFAETPQNNKLIELSYLDPEHLSKTVFQHKLKTDKLYYNSSRGSEPNLELALNFLNELNLVEFQLKNSFKNIKPRHQIQTTFNEIDLIIGHQIDRKQIEAILKNLGFEIEIQGENLNIRVPKFRNDILNPQDVVEEILRIVGIDNIPSKPLEFQEAKRTNQVSKKYQLKEQLRVRAIANEFYETVLYVFGEKKLFEKYGFQTIKNELDLKNPIVDNMDTLRPNAVLGMLEAVQRNMNFGKKRIPLFEIGKVFDKNRNETEKLTIVYSGEISPPAVSNNGKPKLVDFAFFAKKVLSIIGGGTLSQIQGSGALQHPFQTAKILKNNDEVGIIYKLHLEVENDFSLLPTFIAEIDIEKLIPQISTAVEFSKFQFSTRDLSLLVDKNISYSEIVEKIETLKLENLKKVYPIDLFALEEKNSLTVRFEFQSMEKTLSDEEIENDISKILTILNEKLNISLR